MIFGVGTDLVDFERVRETYARYGQRFVGHLLMPEELALFEHAKRPERFLAMRFAAKEAIVKAMGTGFAHGVWLRDTGFVPDRRGRPTVVFSDRGAAVCRDLGAGAAHVSLTDEAGLIAAFAVIERRTED